MKRQMISLLTAALLCLSILATSAVSAESGPTFPQRECTHPTIGFPTCYTLQVDGMWAREELTDTNANWVMTGTVTFDEVAAAYGAGNAIVAKRRQGQAPASGDATALDPIAFLRKNNSVQPPIIALFSSHRPTAVFRGALEGWRSSRYPPTASPVSIKGQTAPKAATGGV